MDNITYAALEAIQDRDPDGGSVEPTPERYAQFEAWAKAAYGEDVWKIYAAGGWGREAGYHDVAAYDARDDDWY